MEARGASQKLACAPQPTVDFAFADLAAFSGTDTAEEYHRAPLRDLGKSAPWLIGLGLVTALSFLWLCWDALPRQALGWWFGLVAATSLWVIGSAYLRRERHADPGIFEAGTRTIRDAVLVGSGWAVCPALFLEGAPADIQLLIVAMTMGASGLGAVALARMPAAALTFSSLLTTSLAVSLLHMSARSTIIVLAYGIALALVVVLAYRRELKFARQLAETRRQAEIIALLLREFEAGASDWIWETGPDGRLTYVSNRMAQVLARDHDRLVGATLRQAAGRPRRSGTWRQVAEVMASRQTLHEVLVPVAARQGTMWWLLTARPLFAADGSFRGYRGVGKDVTARRQSEITVLKAKEAAERESKTKSEFLAVMSYELRTPLNAIVGFSQMLAEAKQGPHTNPNYAEYARSIHQSGRHLESLINDILDITRFERGNMSLVEQDLDLVELVEVCLKMCRQIATENRVTLVDNHGFTRVEVMGDLTRLRQILINLVTNAIKFSPPDSDVEVAVDRLADGRAAVIVSDHGIGIDPATLERVFEPFAQVDGGFSRRFGGLGLGLAIARRLARLHGGDIVITSNLHKGTVARLILPPNRIVATTPKARSAEQAA